MSFFVPFLFHLSLSANDWSVVTAKSGPVNYYKPVVENGVTFIRSSYVPGTKTTVLGWKTPDGDRRRIKKVRWSWRAQTLPKGGDECQAGKEDSAAVVYVTWKSGLRYHVIKYVWSAVGTPGAVCDRKRNPFVMQDTVVLESGGPTNTWKTVEVDLAAEHKKHFGEAPPDFVGLGIMSDGDQTKSESSADFGSFELIQ